MKFLILFFFALALMPVGFVLYLQVKQYFLEQERNQMPDDHEHDT